ncbi:hypothetical protein GCM10022420_042940 [Streptomyces iranensis]
MHGEPAAELAARHGVKEGPVPWGVETRLDGGALVLLPHGTAPGGSAWPLGPLVSFLDVPGSGVPTARASASDSSRDRVLSMRPG